VKISKSHTFLNEASAVIPGGASSNVRCRNTIAISHGKGAELWDLDGNKYIDYILGFGPILLGHSNEQIKNAVYKAMEDGTTFAFTTEMEYLLCKEIVNICPSVEMVRLCNSGTDAAVTAFRIASTATGRSKVVKIHGDYNGGFDLLAFDVPGVEASDFYKKPSPIGTGFIRGVNSLIITIPFNDISALEFAFEKNKGQIAAVFMEPILGNVASIMPENDYLRIVKDICKHYGAILVFDEVKTGFRVSLGGAQELFDVYADLSMFGKAIGNGMPIAAIGGKRELMELVTLNKVFHCGSYYGNLPCTAAALATISLLKKCNYEELNNLGIELAKGMCIILEKSGIAAQWQGTGSMFGITIGDIMPHSYSSWWLNTDREKWMNISYHMNEYGVLSDNFIGLFFMSYEHNKHHIELTLDACEQAIKRLNNN
jgi:glutamate-1-semialdehyde 2,1-aminomutase